MSASIALSRREMSQCYHCGLQAVQPKLLPCLHTFCLQCLKLLELQLPERSLEGSRMACPECSTEFVVPRQGLRGLQSDIFVERLVKMQKGLCDVCSDDQSCANVEIPPASKYCSLCSQGLCERCSVEHSRQKLLKAHTLVDFSVETAFEQARQHPSNMCLKHLTVVSTQFYCLACQRFVCNTCLLEGHIEHEWSRWEEVVKKFRSNLKWNIDQVSVLLSDVVKRRDDVVAKDTRLFNSKTKETELQIRKRCRELRELIDRHENALLDELESLKQTRLLQMNEEINEKFGRSLIQLEAYKNYCTAVTDNGSPIEIDWAMNDLNLPERCEKLKSQRDTIADSSHHLSSFVGLSFELPDEDTILYDLVSVGKVKTQTASLKGSYADSPRVDFEVVQARSNTVARHVRLDTGGKEVWGVTSMNKYIYILSQDSVLKYDSENPSKSVEEIDIPQQKYLTDIAASPIDRCLYVTDQGDSATSTGSCIWKIAIGTDKYRVSKWLARIFVRLFTLSVSSKGHVTVPLSAKGSNKLRIYNADGKPMKEINLPDVIVFLNHAIELASGNFVVAFGKSGDYRHGVCEISGSGQVVKSICDSQVLNHPWHVTVFANDELLIGDSKNDRILWLNSDLTVKRELLTKDKDGITEPRRMCYAEQSDLLMIVHMCDDGKRVVDLYDSSLWLN